MSRLSDVIAAHTRREISRRRQIRVGRFVRPYGLRRGIVTVGACEQVITGDRLADIAPGDPVLVASDGTAHAILSAPAVKAGPASARTKKLAGSVFVSAKLTITPTIVNDDIGTLTEDELAIYLDGVLVATSEEVAVTTGAHALTYDLPAGYTASAWGGDVAADGTFTAVLGAAISATITFDDEPQELTVSDVVACDAFASSGGPTDGAGCQHLVTAGLAPASYAFHRWEAYLGGAVTAGDTIRATIISPAGVIFGSGGGPTTTIDITASAINDPWPSGNQRCSQATLGAATMMITGENGGEFLGIPTGATQSTPVRLQFDNITDPTTSPQIESLTISGTGVANCSA